MSIEEDFKKARSPRAELMKALDDTPEFRFTGGTARETIVWQRRFRLRLAKALNLDEVLFSRREVPPVLETAEVVEDGYTRKKVYIRSEGDYWIPSWLLVPDGAGPFPAMLCCHGHGYSAKDGTAGITENPMAVEDIARHKSDYGLRMVKRGFVALCPDVRGFDEFSREELKSREFVEYSRTRENVRAGYGLYEEPEDGDLKPNKAIFCNLIALEYLHMGTSLLGKRILDHIREADFLFSLPFVRADRVGIMGLSMGSEHSSYVAGLDERFACAVLSCNHIRWLPLLRRMGPRGHCQYVAGLGRLADKDDVGCLIPPRPVFVEHGLKDKYDRRETEEAIAKLHRAYECLNASENMEVQWFDAGHMFWGERSIPWLERLLSQPG